MGVEPEAPPEDEEPEVRHLPQEQQVRQELERQEQRAGAVRPAERLLPEAAARQQGVAAGVHLEDAGAEEPHLPPAGERVAAAVKLVAVR